MSKADLHHDEMAELYERIAELEAELASRPPAPAWTSEPPRVAGRYLRMRPGRSVILMTIFDAGLDWESSLWYGPIPEPPA